MMADEWAGVVSTTAPNYLKGALDQTKRKRLWVGLLKKRGRISYNNGGLELRWQLEMGSQNVQQQPDATTLNFARFDAYRQMVLGYRGYAATDLMTEKEKLANSGNAQLINRYKTIVPRLQKSMLNQFGLELYIDGTQPGNEERFLGIESFMATTGTTTAADMIAAPGSTYAGKSCVLGNQGGSWSTNETTKPNAALGVDWPNGTGSGPEYDYNSPKLVNWSSTAWSGQTGWESNCERALRQMLIWQGVTSGEDGKPDLVMLDPVLYAGFANRESSKQRIIVPYKDAQDLGFTDVMRFEGAGVHYEYGTPPNTGYGINLEEMELKIMQDQLLTSAGPVQDLRVNGWLFLVSCFGNFQFNPKSFGKLFNYA